MGVFRRKLSLCCLTNQQGNQFLASQNAVVFPVVSASFYSRETPSEKMHAHARSR
jgi:hypothetical protein